MAPATEDGSEHLAFLIGDDEYAVPILKVREIAAVSALTRVPGAPAWIRGVANLRGQVLPVIDLAVKFGLPQRSEATPRSCIVVFEVPVEGQLAAVGALVDAVSRVLTLGASQVEPPPRFGTQIRAEFLIGAAPVDGRFILLLDSDLVLCADELLAATALAADEATVPGASARAAAGPGPSAAVAEAGCR
jgi:purine-binding chemotaxis protein CheW